MVGITEEVDNLKKEIKELQEESFAYEMLKDQKRQNKRQFIIILVIITMWFLTTGYLVFVLYNSRSTEHKEQTFTKIDNIENTDIINGDTNYKE